MSIFNITRGMNDTRKNFNFFLIVLICSFVLFSIGQLIIIVEPYFPSSSNTKVVTTSIVNNKEVKVELTLNKDKEVIGSQVVK